MFNLKSLTSTIKMGLMDFLNKPKTNNQKKELNLGQENKLGEININRLDKISTMAFRIKIEGTIKHSDGSITNLVSARVINYRDGDAIIFDAADSVCFEIPRGRTDLIKEIIDKSYSLNLNQKTYTYIGRIYEAEDYRIQPPSVALNSKIDQMNQELIQERQIKELQKRLSMEEQRRAQIAKEEELKAKYEERNVQDEQEKLRRIQNPILKGGINKEFGEIYNGINLHNGEILRIRDVRKQAKDLSGTYIYTASLSSTPNEDDVELLAGDTRVPVVFTLPYRLNDIVNSDYDENYKQQLIKQILNLLSEAYESNLTQGKSPDTSKIHDVGGINKNGEIISNTEKNVSKPIITKIKELQSKYLVAQRQEQENNSMKHDYEDR